MATPTKKELKAQRELKEYLKTLSKDSEVFTGLTAGSNTFSMQYRANTGTATFTRRNIVVLDMGS